MKKSFKKALSLTLATSMAFALPISVSADDELAKVTLPSSGLLYAFDFADGSLANKGTVGGTAAIVGGGSITDGYFDNASTAELATKRVNYMSLPNAKAVAKDINTSANKGLTFSTKIKLVAGKYSEWSPIFVMDSTSNPAKWPVFAAELRGTAAWNSAGWFNGDNTKNADVFDGLSTEKWATLTIVANGNEGEGGKLYTYVDGTLMNSTDIQGFDSAADNSILGILGAGSDTFFQGVDTAMLGGGQPLDWEDPDAQVLYDDVLLYDSALSAEQVALLSETGVVNTAVAALSTEEDPTSKPAETETTTKAAETKTTTKAAETKTTTKAAETKTTTKAAETETTTAAASTVEVKVAGNASVKSDVVTVAVKKKVKLDVTVEPSQKVTYTTSNKKVATVTSKGLVKGLKKGKAVITVTTADGRTTVAYTVNVVKKSVKNKVLKVAKKTLKVKAGETAQITLKKTTKNTTDKVTYKTNAKKVATVDKYGLVTAKKKGTAKITVKCGKKSVKVTVKVTK